MTSLNLAFSGQDLLFPMNNNSEGKLYIAGILVALAVIILAGYFLSPFSFTFDLANLHGSLQGGKNPQQYAALVSPGLDTTPPIVSSFDMQPRTISAGNYATASFNVTDSGGSHIVRVALNRAPYSSSGCNVADKSSCDWISVANSNTSSGLDSWTGTLMDNPGQGTWWYGFMVVDGANNFGYEPATVEVIVTAAVPTPTPGADTIKPKVTSFDVQPRNINVGSSVKVSFTVVDSGGSHLSRVGINRALYNSTNCNASVKTGCQWVSGGRLYPTSGLDSWSSSADNSPALGTWWYGIYVTDNGGNFGYEPYQIQVIVNPASTPTATPSPTATPTPTPTPTPRPSSTSVPTPTPGSGGPGPTTPPTPTPTPTPVPTGSDTIRPKVNAFDVQPRTLNVGGSVLATFTVSDTGGSHLSKVGFSRASYNSSNCSETVKTTCQWVSLAKTATPYTDNWNSSWADTPSAGTWWYGMSATDGAGNVGYEPATLEVFVNTVSSTPTSTPVPVPTATPSQTPVPTPAPTPTPIPTPVPTAIPTPTPTPSPTVTQNYSFGFSVAESFLPLSSAELNARMDDLVALHIGWLRFDIDWSSVQGLNSTIFDWTAIDNLISAANSHHIKLMPVIDSTPPWARPANCTSNKWCPPADNNAFANFAKAVVQRYTPQGVHTWEIWNEPNINSFWQSGPNSSAYANLLTATYNAIKSVDSSATVISAGLAPAATQGSTISPVDFLTSMYQAGAKNYFDAVGFHPYSFPAMPSYYAVWNAWSQMSSTPTSLRSVMSANGDSAKQIWLTEYGAPTGGPGAVADVNNYNFSASPDHVTEALQASMYQDSINLVRGYSWAGPMFFYSYKDLGTSSSTNENFFGVIRYDGTQKPAYQTVKQLLAQ